MGIIRLKIFDLQLSLKMWTQFPKIQLQRSALVNVCQCESYLLNSNMLTLNPSLLSVLKYCHHTLVSIFSVEDFNRRVLSPDVSQSEFVELHMTAKDLYKSYCAPNALDRIKFDEDIIEALREGKIILLFFPF